MLRLPLNPFDFPKRVSGGTFRVRRPLYFSDDDGDDDGDDDSDVENDDGVMMILVIMIRLVVIRV